MDAIRQDRKRFTHLWIILTIFLLGLQGLSTASASADCLSVSTMDTLAANDGTFEGCGGDDFAYKIPLGGTVIFGGVSYSSIYASTNSVITFGAADTTYWTFPPTPSISLDSYDWMERGFYSYDGIYSPVNGSTPRSDEHFKITVSGNTFRVDIAARPWSTYYDSLQTGIPDGSPRLMSLYFVRNSDGTLKIRSFSSNAADANLRNGCVLSQGATPISLEECGIYEVLTLESLDGTTPIDFLVALTPVLIEETSDSVICKSANLRYMVQGTFAQNPTLQSQAYSLKLDGQVIAEKSSLASTVTFAKSSIAKPGSLTCVQSARQGDASLTIESANFGAVKAAASAKEKLISVAKKAYFDKLQTLGQAKMIALRQSSNGEKHNSYQAAIETWKAGIIEAQNTLEAAIEAANKGEIRDLASAGAQITFKN